MPSQSFISIQNVEKHFGKVRAVDNISLDVAEGEFFALLGPSGCGKTTLLRMLAGFETPTNGKIYIDSDETSLVPHYLRPVNMVFQNYAIFPHLNVFQNIAFGLRKDKLSKEELAKRVYDALALIKMEGYGDRQPNELSGGQRQRVALARALVKKPKVLLLDEPLGALDKKLREQMQLELRLLQKKVGITFVFVTHDQEEALTMSDRIAIMSAGKIQEVGTPSPNTGEVRVKLQTSALNRRDYWITNGQYPGMQLPCIAGSDGAGIVDRVGEGVDPNLVGQEVVLYPALAWGDNEAYFGPDFRVLGMPDQGTFAEYICTPWT
ncbi:MAG: ATP-binding cassette domain-containing protein, partial [Sneathiella sp.]